MRFCIKFIAMILIIGICAGLLPSCTGTKREGPEWYLSVPEYDGGSRLSDAAYNIGAGIDCDPEAVGGKLAVISGTNKKEFDSYLKKLEKKGYTKTSENEINENIFVQYQKGEELLYVYFVNAYNEVRIIEDYVSVPESEFEYSYTAKEGETTTIYQYALMTDPTGGGSGGNCDARYFNNGMFYIIRLADNSVILIDGGASYQVNSTGTEKLMDFLCQITNTPEGEKVRVAAVLLTHAHEDHKKYVENLVTDFSDRIEIERAMYNIPSYSILVGSGGFDTFGRMLKEKYPDIQFLKPHTGQKIQLADVQMEIVYTHEDMVNPQTGIQQITEYNNASIVVKFTIHGKTFMLLGDVGGGNLAPEEYPIFEERFIGMYDDPENEFTFPVCEFLRSDIVQVSHHGINFYMSKIYQAIKARFALFPQADCRYEDYYHDCYPWVIQQLYQNGINEIYFMGRKTWAVDIAQDGTMNFESSPILGADPEYESYLDKYKPYDRDEE